MNKGNKFFTFFFVMPAFVILFGVVFFPFLYNVVISFSNMNLRHIQDWHLVGLTQYIKVFTEPTEPNFYTIFLKTIIWTGTNIVFHVVIGVFLAILLNQSIKGKSIYRTLLILPWAIPQYIVALTWRGMFNYEYGSINQVLTRYMHMPAIEWLKNPTEAFIACILTNVWLGYPFMMVVALGALQSIPHELYEAADIDGAKWY
ncbi:MAG TPA: sugar ABC transporter permease, partial [Bacteroidota bacterium]|nr:sugar ABC transporter permease [Bacteroidota bacterium]